MDFEYDRIRESPIIILQVQAPAPRRSLPLRPPVLELLLRGCDRERAYARGHRRYPDLWGPDQSLRAPPFPGDRGQGRLPLGPYLEFIARVTSHIPDKGQVTVRYFSLYANAHRGKVRKASLGPFPLGIVGEELRPVPSRGWAEMIRKVYEVDPMVCPQCGGQMRIIAFLTDSAVVDRIIEHLKLTFVADRPPPPQIAH